MTLYRFLNIPPVYASDSAKYWPDPVPQPRCMTYDRLLSGPRYKCIRGPRKLRDPELCCSNRGTSGYTHHPEGGDKYGGTFCMYLQVHPQEYMCEPPDKQKR